MSCIRTAGVLFDDVSQHLADVRRSTRSRRYSKSSSINVAQMVLRSSSRVLK